MTRRLVAFATITQLLSCGSKPAPPPQKPLPSPLSDKALVQIKDLPEGLDLRLSDGKQGAPAFDRTRLAPATKLADAEAQKLLARAQPIKDDAADKKDFALREKSQPPPRTGKVVTGQFPAPAISLLPPKANDAGKELQVLRYMPEGAVPLAPELSITFSHPMVAVTSQDDAAKTVPVTLTPQPPGRWRWLGTRTLLFDPQVRFPQATTYQVVVPAGTRSATGETSKTATTWSFETPPATVAQSYPPEHEPQKLDVPMFIKFDQRIDQVAMLGSIAVEVDGKVQPIRLMASDELAADKRVQSLVDAAKKAEHDGRWIAFRTTAKLPQDAQVSVTVKAGAPSVEGKNTTKSPQSYTFRTYPPLEIERAQCGWGGECRPNMPFNIVFNNPLDDDRFDSVTFAVSPAIPGEKITQSYNAVVVSGMTAARTTYKVVVPAGLTDAFGQTLGTDTTLTWTVGDAMPTMFGPSGLVVADPSAKTPTLDVFTTNYSDLVVKLYRVAPSDYDGYTRYMRERWNHDKPPPVPGKLVFDKTIATTKGTNKLVETSIDLSPALSAARLGNALVIVEPSPWPHNNRPPQLIAWVQATKLAVDAFVDHENLLAFTTDLATGKPVKDAKLALQPFGITAASDDKGLATLPLRTGGVKGSHYLTATVGNDVAFITDDNYYSEYGNWVRSPRGQSLAWYVIDDRKMYKPGEEVSLKGWLRVIDHGKAGDVRGLDGAVSTVRYKVRDSQGNQIATGAAQVSALGGFDTTFTLPKTPNLGYASIQFEATGKLGGSYGHGFQIQEFRRPEFAVSAAASQGPFIVGDPAGADVTVTAKYYAGGPLPGAPVNWNVSTSQTSFTPPNRDEFVFGSWEPWWGYRSYFDDESGGRYKPPQSWNHAGKTDATGAHVLHFDFLSVKPSKPMSVVAHANVTDVNRQGWSASAAMIVHPSTAYVGVKTKKPFVEKGVPFDVDVIGVDLDGKSLVGTAIEVRTVRKDWEYKKGKYVEKEVDPQTCSIVAAKDPVPCSFTTKAGGTYELTATILDAKGRPNQTTLTFWVSGGDQPPEREVKQQQVQLIPDAKEYRPGMTAELMLQAPFFPAEALVSWRRSGIVKTERIVIDGPTKVLRVPIVDGMTPNLTVQVDLVGAAPRTNDKGEPDPKLPTRPAYASGEITLPIPPKHRTLAITATPAAAKVAPGEQTTIALEVKGADGRPVANAEAAVIVVDEAILSLTGYQFPDPVGAFHPYRDEGTRDHYLRGFVKLARPDAAALTAMGNTSPTTTAEMDGMAAPMAEPSPSGGAPPPPPPPAPPGEARATKAAPVTTTPGQPTNANTAIAIRANFNPLAAFSPSVKTDAAGKATVTVKVPDNLTRYRIVAIAVAGDKQYGKGESSLTARLPLMVRPSPPRFLNFGDTFRLPVVVQNQTDAPMTVTLAVRATNAAITDGSGRSVTVPANDRVEVQFPAAAEMAGTARFQIVGTNGTNNDAAELALPVWTPATTEAFATYGVIDQGAIRQPVALPGKVVTQFGGLEVTTASTNLQALTDAMLYLVKYPFECAEQRASRVLAIAALRDVLTAFEVKDMPSKAALEASVKVDIERLSQMQNYDGGFAYWDRFDPSVPYLTVYVTNALAHAKAKGFAVPQGILDRAKPYLKDIESKYPWYYSVQVKRAISAYALYTRKALGDLDIPKAQKLYAESKPDKTTSMETYGWLLGTMAGNKAAEVERKAIVQHVLNNAKETAGAVAFTTGYADGNHLLLSSDRRVDAVLLESLILEQPKLDLIPKIVTGLLGHRKAGRWLNTQENTFALVALDTYFQTYEKATPDFVARVWLGTAYAGDKAFKGRSTDYFLIPIAMKDVVAHDKQDLTIMRDGNAGRLYYRVGMTYAPESLKLDAADYGFVVDRKYEALDNPSDVSRDAQGVWHVKAGARVRVKLSMVNESRRYHVALVDPIPAGLEAMNPALAVTGPIPTDPNEQKSRGAYWWWYGPWYEHQNMRDERIEAFAAMLWEGVHTYSYVARATTPGTFVVPPAKAEEMYMPETFGRSASDRLIVE